MRRYCKKKWMGREDEKRLYSVGEEKTGRREGREDKGVRTESRAGRND